MIRYQADADIHQGIVVAVRRREPAIDFASAADSKLEGVSDPDVLEIAGSQGRILITHDRRTMLDHFRNRLQEGKSSPGVFLVSQFAPLGPVVEALSMVWAASDSAEWQNQVVICPPYRATCSRAESKPEGLCCGGHLERCYSSDMIDLTKDIQSLTTFRRNSAVFLKQLKKTKRPVVLTVKGKAKAIVQDAAAYQRLLDIAALADPYEGIRQGLEDVRQGRVQDIEEFFAEFEAKHGISR